MLPELADASVRGRIASGGRAGQWVLRSGDRIDVEDLRETASPLCANVGGLSLHANVAVPATDRRRLERLCRYVARPPLATERLSRLPDGRLLLRLKHRWRDGTTHIVFEPLELIEKLATLIPSPRGHLVRYHGVLGPAAPPRAGVVADAAPPAPRAPELVPGQRSTESASRCPSHSTRPPPPDPTRGRARRAGEDRAAGPPVCADPQEHSTEKATKEGVEEPIRARRLPWAELMRRVFAVDILECPRCQGAMRIVSAIERPAVIVRILSHFALPSRAPPPTPANMELPDSPAPGFSPDR